MLLLCVSFQFRHLDFTPCKPHAVSRWNAGYDVVMGKLIHRKDRKQEDKDRLARRASILSGARKAILSQPKGELTLETLDRAAAVRLGTASMFFGSIEGVVFRLLREEISSWLEALTSDLQEAADRMSPADLSGLLATGLLDRPLLCRLLALLSMMADRHSMEMALMQELETWRLHRLEEAGVLVESRCSDLPNGGGLVILRRAILLAGALEPLINPPSALLLAMKEERLAPLYPDAGEELRALLTAILSNPPLS